MGIGDSVLLTDVAYNRFFIDSEYIFVVAPQMKSIYMFDKDGKFIKSIGERGRAYGEFVAARSVNFDSHTGLLMVEGGSKAVLYSVNDGSCAGDFDFGELFDKSSDVVLYGKNGRSQILSNMTVGKIILKNNEFYLIVGDNTTLEQFLLIVDMDMKIKTSVEIRKTEMRNFFNRVLISRFHFLNDTINIFYGLMDTVYSYSCGKLVPRVAVNYGNFQTLATQKSRKESANSMQVAVGYPFIESAAMIAGTVFLPSSAIVYSNGSQYSNFVYDKASRKSVIVDYQEEFGMAGFINDIDGGMPFWPQQLSGGKMYSFVDAGTFIEMSEKCNSPKMKEVARKLTEESNPVLVEVALK